MLLEALLLGILFGLIRGGSLKRLGFLSVRFPVFAYFSIIIMLGTNIMITLGNPFAIEQKLYLYMLSYFLLFMALLLNLHYKSIWLITIGAITNFLAILFNSGKTPIDTTVLEKINAESILTSIEAGLLPQFIPLEEAYGFTVYLGKIVGLHEAYPFKHILSVGDILISIGLFLLIQSMMTSDRSRRSTKTIKFDYNKRI
ncbi:DUF5317 domain-containing protein [Serpentinicella sp. ANB-PHB4]|uniref:DUF5317 domain-containing protein n=1 Tax=Serpentinicella sp. ANB-PHB4 TaxID=3074076 RepID=UPI00285D5959|nr:DUF5317 domain-containing protein [Serpentinicella sp. ANB-PHB4]MDR5659799.1 DUF5317 domain-containing protein [Serpentinicella sp. ANB-PHB4]